MVLRAPPDWHGTAFEVLADPRRRFLLAVLDDRSEPVALETLATDVATRERDTPIVTTERTRSVRLECVHNHVPRLAEAGIVTETANGSSRRLALADHPMLEAEWVRSLIDRPTGGPGRDPALLDRTLEVLRPARRRTVCRLLARHDRLPVHDLSMLLVAETSEELDLVDVDETDRKPVQTRLVHDDLAALADAGLVAFDREDGVVSLERDAPAWEMEWVTLSPLGAIVDGSGSIGRRPVRDRQGAGPEGCACWTITGRENVIARGHELADTATEEFFVSVPEQGMLQHRCLERWRAAADRGVDVCVCSGSDAVRSTIRDVIPEATICKPQGDWLNFPAAEARHGRVLFADRKRVMLVTVDESADTSSVKAITADGTGSTLVTLAREHLGTRLDRLATQGLGDADEDGSTPLPF